MNRINRPLLLISFIIAALSGVAILIVNRLQVSRYGDFYYDRAQDTLKTGNVSGAVEQFRLAIRLGKQDFDAYSELARALLQIPDPPAAFMAGLGAERMRAGDTANQRLLVESALLMGQFTDAQRWAEKLLERYPEDPEYLVLLAQSKAGSRSYADAAADYEKAIENPNVPMIAYVELASLYADRLDDLERGRQVMDRLIANSENSDADRIVQHGTWYLTQHAKRSISSSLEGLDRVQQLLDVASADAIAATEHFPDNPQAFVFAIRVASSAGRLEHAFDLAELSLARFPKERELYALAASVALELGRKEKAADWIKNGLSNFPTDSGLLWEQANLLLEQKDFAQGTITVKKLAETSIPGPQLRYIQARYLAGQGNYLEAIKEFENVRADLVQSPEFQKLIDLDLAKCYESIGDRPGQIQVLRRATAQNSGWLAARELLAIALLASGRIDEATGEYYSIANRAEAPAGATLNLARLLVIQNLSRDPSRRDWNQVDSILKRIEEVVGVTDEIAIVRAESLIARDRIDEARKVLNELTSSDTSYAARILLEVNQRIWSEADRLIDEAQTKGFDSVELRRARAIRAVLGESPDLIKLLPSLAKAPETWNESKVLELQKELIPIASSGNLDDLVKELGLAVLEKDPTNLTSRFEILEIQRKNRDRAGMQETLLEIEKISGRNAIWNYGQAVALVIDEEKAKREDYDLAQQYLNEASMLRPDWPDASILSGALYDKVGESEAAILEYEQGIKLGWKRLEIAQRLLNLLMMRGRFAEADDVVRRLSQSSPALSSRMSRAASEISWKLDNLQRALEKAEEAARLSQESEDFLWLSQIKRINKDRAGAEGALKKALELSPASSIVQVAWIDFLRDTARMDEARTAAMELESRIDQSKVMDLVTLAEVFRALRMSQDVSRTVARIDRSRLQTLDEYARYFSLISTQTVTERMKFLESLISASKNEAVTNSEAKIAPWARRQMALEYVNGIASPDFTAARNLLNINLSENPKSIEDRKVAAIIAAVEKGHFDPSESLSMFQALLQEGWSPNAEEQFILGQLFIAKGDWTEGSRYFNQLLNRSEDRNPDHMKRYVRLLLGRNDANEAELWLDVLRREGIQDAELAELLADIRFQRGQYVELARGLQGTETKYPETAWFQATLPLRRRFELLNVYLTKLKGAGDERAYNLFAKASDEMQLQLESAADFPGAFYAEQLLLRKEYAKAVTALEKVVSFSSQSELVEFAERMLTSEEVPTAQVEQLEQLFAKSERSEDEAVFRVIVARLKEMRGDTSGAEQKYRELLKANPKNTVALNNLANLLSLKGEKLDEALSLVNQAIAIEGETAMLLDTRGVCYLAKGNLSEARQDLESAVKLYPHPLLRFHLAWVMIMAKELATAKQELIKAQQSGLKKSMTHNLERSTFDKMMSELNLEMN